MNWLVRAITTPLCDWATLCWQRMCGTCSYKEKILTDKLTTVDIVADDTLAIENTLATIVALTTRMRIGYLS